MENEAATSFSDTDTERHRAAPLGRRQAASRRGRRELPLGFQGQYLFSYGQTLASSMETSSAQESQKFCTHRQLCAYLEVMPALGAAFGGLAGTWPPEAYGSRFRTWLGVWPARLLQEGQWTAVWLGWSCSAGLSLATLCLPLLWFQILMSLADQTPKNGCSSSLSAHHAVTRLRDGDAGSLGRFPWDTDRENGPQKKSHHQAVSIMTNFILNLHFGHFMVMRRPSNSYFCIYFFKFPKQYFSTQCPPDSSQRVRWFFL